MLYDLEDLRTRVQQRSDMENNDFVTDSELNELICQAQEELDDVLLDAQAHNYRRKTSTVVSVALTTEYELPSDFKRLQSVRFEHNGEWFTLQAFQPDRTLEKIRRNWSYLFLPEYQIYYKQGEVDSGNAVAGVWMIEFDTVPTSAGEQIHVEYIPHTVKLVDSGGPG